MQKKQKKIRDGIWEESGHWYYRFMVKGRRYFGSNPLWENIDDVRTARDRHRRAVREGKEDAYADTNFATFVKKIYLPWAETNLSPDTCYSYRWRSDDLCEAFGKFDLTKISTLLVEKFKQEQLKRKTKRGGDQTPASVNRYLILLGSIFMRAEKLELIKSAERPRMEPLKESNTRIRYLTVAEESALREAASKRYPYLADIICVACSTGLRRDELFSLKRADVDLGLNLVHVLDGKGGKARTVPLDPGGEARRILEARILNPTSEYIFPSPQTDDKLTGVDRSLLTVCRETGIEPVTLHVLRHTFGTRLVAAGVDLRTVQQLMGHGKIQTTMRYVHLVDANTHTAVAKLSQYATSDSNKTTPSHVGESDDRLNALANLLVRFAVVTNEQIKALVEAQTTNTEHIRQLIERNGSAPQ